MTSHQPTPEQSAIISAGLESRTSLLIQAMAGCAKTSTLEMLTAAMDRAGAHPPLALGLAFNVKTKHELELRVPPWVQVLTLNGLGHRAWGSAIRKPLTIDDKKLGKLTTAVLKAEGIRGATSEQWDAIRGLAAAAQLAGLVHSKWPHKGLVPDTPEEWQRLAVDRWIEAGPLIVELARAVLCESTLQAFAGVISFDDQIYMSCMFNGQFPRFPLVFGDEIQDFSALNILQLRAVAADRMVLVGDKLQSIYQFRGADATAIDKIRALRPAWIELPLRLTFRCPKVVVARQQVHAPGFTAFERNPEGEFHRLEAGPPVASWTWPTIEGLRPTPAASIAVLCRNNAPLLSLAFKLIRRRQSVVMLGRDIGKGLSALAKKISSDDGTSTTMFLTLLTAWEDSEAGLAEANGHDEKLASIHDRAECLRAVTEGARPANVGALREALAELFSRPTGQITLSTIHRAKGLEWDLVLALDPWRTPSKWALAAARAGDPRPLEQERNLEYVRDTRTRHTLVYANLENFT